MFYVEVNGLNYPSCGLPPTSTNKKTIDRRERRKRNKMSDCFCDEAPVKKGFTFGKKKSLCELASLPCEVPVVPTEWTQQYYLDAPNECMRKQEGTTPMRYNDNYASASAIVNATKPDIQNQREYFLSRLNAAEYPKRESFTELFNMNVLNDPQSFADLIDRIKKDAYKINPKVQRKYDDAKASAEEDDRDLSWYHCCTYGIIWDGPKADNDGYNAALEAMGRQQTIAQDIIMSGDAAAMKAAVEAFEAWTPTGTAN